MYAARMGWEPTKKPARQIKEESRKGDLGELIAMFGGGGAI